MIRRRDALVLGANALIGPSIAFAAPPERPIVGFLSSGDARSFEGLLGAFRAGLAAAGFADGKNVSMQYAWADGHYERLPTLAAEFVRRRVDVIAATGGEPSAQAAKAATPSIPIVFTGSDPIAAGLVASMNRPGGNVTGVTLYTAELGPKRLQLLQDILPKADEFGVLLNPATRSAGTWLKSIEDTMTRAGIRLITFRADSLAGIERAFAAFAQKAVDALLVANDPFFFSRRGEIVALAARHRLPTICEFREFVAAGGLVSYGTDIKEMYRQAGDYAGKILLGARPGDLPVLVPTKFELVLNLKTAKSLGLRFPDSIVVRADEVIE